jgi:hypothetical protein
MKAALTILLLMSLCSCGFVHKVFDKNKQHKKEVVKLQSDSSAIHKTDSAGSKTSDSTSVKKTEEKQIGRCHDRV